MFVNNVWAGVAGFWESFGGVGWLCDFFVKNLGGWGDWWKPYATAVIPHERSRCGCILALSSRTSE
ncbi:MAG: hypothetical protein LAT57_07740, partial [Balneolales bacterium]|nr:hypothetical protein [Balneolales bacterium]